MSISKTLGTLITTILVGSVAFLFSAPNKAQKSKSRVAKTTSHPRTHGSEDLFI